MLCSLAESFEHAAGGNPSGVLCFVAADNTNTSGLFYLLTRLQFPNLDVLPTHLIWPCTLPDTVDLQADEAGGIHFITEVGAGNVVDPRAYAVALCDDAIVIPLAFLESLLRFGFF